MTACPLCGAATDARLLAKAAELRPAIRDLIRQNHAGWQCADGICPVCAQHYAWRLAAAATAISLHTVTDPPTTFPYFHAAEEEVQSLPARLSAYSTFTGRGVTIAFLDSGYYPHPDLSTSPLWPDPPAWEELNVPQLKCLLSARPIRLAEFVDLADDGERIGLDLPSLWDGGGDSWHGQMTSVIACGNGLLSAGRYRGYAPGAQALAIKIGRGGGRIPEEDILRGLQWLLTGDNVARYQVRVLNVSVGGDFDEPWQKNPVCLAAEELVARGVFIAAAAGNSNKARLLAPAQAPSVLTVGGLDDQNRTWSPHRPGDVACLELYPHNWGETDIDRQSIRKPELVALARWLPSPILPGHAVIREAHAIDRLRRLLTQPYNARLDALLAHWRRTLRQDPIYAQAHPDDDPAAWLAEIWRALRKRMNAHKWIHTYYQHVEGTSVAVAQVSAVASQMLQANPNLTPVQIRSLLQETALPLPHLPPERTGAGLLQPAAAVAAALRAHGGPLAGYPVSGTVSIERSSIPAFSVQGAFSPELRDHAIASRVSARSHRGSEQPVYFGLLAPAATAVSLVGSFNGWQPDRLPLQPARNGWWHTGALLSPGRHVYRFWVASPDAPEGDWLPDPENQAREEGGYMLAHSVVVVGDLPQLAVA